MFFLRQKNLQNKIQTNPHKTTEQSKSSMLVTILMFQLAMLLLFHTKDSTATQLFAVHICGNYCGPGWCNAEYLNEQNCDDSSAPETWWLTGESCADSCCKTHDTCCGHGDRSVCNRNIVNCLDACDSYSLTCTLDMVPVSPAEISTAMGLIENYCCGSPCDESGADALVAEVIKK